MLPLPPAAASAAAPSVRWYAAATAKPRSLVLHLHSGAFTSGGLAQGERVAALLGRSGALVLSLAYPLAPDHRFPVAVEAAHAALGWLAKEQHARVLPAAPLVVAGEEAGACIAAAAAMVCRDRAGPALAAQVLVSPMLDPRVATRSFRAFMRDSTQCRWMDGWRAYLRGPQDIDHPYAVPSRALRLQGLPRTLVVTAEDDPTRDEAGHFARRLETAGVDVVLRVLPPPTGWPVSLAASPSEGGTDALLAALLTDFLGRG